MYQCQGGAARKGSRSGPRLLDGRRGCGRRVEGRREPAGRPVSFWCMAIASTVLLLTATATLAPFQQGEWRTDFSRHSVALEEIVSGGPPRDGIPALDRPRFEAGGRVGWLDMREPVIVVAAGRLVRAYPIQILMWHEIVNDELDGLPIAVTFCPLCNTALVFERRIDSLILDFGTTGRLRHSDLVMYDRQTESWWQQATGEAIVGALTGRHLRPVPAAILSWRDARALYPAIEVLSRETGHRRPYGRNPYERYDSRPGPLSQFFRHRPDARLPAMERVVAIELDTNSIAVAFSMLRERRIVNTIVGVTPVVVAWWPGTASALDAADIPAGRDVGSTIVFERTVDGRAIDFRLVNGTLMDGAGGTVWDLAGRGIRGPLAGRRLRAVPHGNHFWFAWAAFRPAARLLR